jgi:biopolymer transport protein ExbB
LFESRLHIAEAGRYDEVLKEAAAARNNPDISPAQKVELAGTVVDTALSRIEAALGGEVFDSEVLAVSGRIEQGKTALLGPVAVFGSSQSDEAGVVQAKLNTVGPALVAIGEQRGEAIRGVVTTGEGSLPVDATMGNAIKIAEKTESPWEHIRKGGPVMIPILLLGIVAVIICLLKWLQVSRVQTASPRDLQTILEHVVKGAKELALKRARAIRGPVGDMLGAGIEHASEQKEFVEEVMYEKMLDAKPKLERFVPIIAVSAAAAPLLGLLGTVTGMINTFKLIAIFGAGDPRSLSTGISEALITTEFGLIVAIPSLLMHAFVSRKVKGFMGSMEQTSVAFINGVPESLAAGAPAQGKETPTEESEKGREKGKADG